MTILEALQKSNKIKRSCWTSYIIFKEHIIFTERNDPYIMPASDIRATDWEPVIEKKKLCKALYKRRNGEYYESATFYVVGDDFAPQSDTPYDEFIKLLPHTEIEV